MYSYRTSVQQRNEGAKRIAAIMTMMIMINTNIQTHTLRWDGMGWVALITQCISLDEFTHWVTSAAHPVPSHSSVCVCVNAPQTYSSNGNNNN